MSPTLRLDPAPFVVRTLSLPAVGGGVEELPVPVDTATGVPARYASRWLLRSERWTDAPSTLLYKAYALARLYTWGHRRLPGGVDARILRNEPFTVTELDGLVMFLRDRSNPRASSEATTISASTVAKTLGVCEKFLTWALRPEQRGSEGTIDAPTHATATTAMQAAFGRHRHGVGKGTRIPPLTLQASTAFDEILAYQGGRVGEQWHEENPFKPIVRLRNYCMLGLMRYCGLRAGEMLSLREDDVMVIPLDMVDRRTGEVTAPNTPVVRIVRRHNVPGDTRKRRAFVKTLGRYLPLPAPLHAALVRYLQTVPPIGRRGVETPMLFVSTQGEEPLSKTALDLTLIRMGGALQRRGLEGTSPHGLRHTFFEEQADHLMAKEGANNESVANILRQLGGWEINSSMPFHYAAGAYRRHSNRMLVAFNEGRFAPEPQGVPLVGTSGLRGAPPNDLTGLAKPAAGAVEARDLAP